MTPGTYSCVLLNASDPNLIGKDSATDACLPLGAAVSSECAPGDFCLKNGACYALAEPDKIGRSSTTSKCLASNSTTLDTAERCIKMNYCLDDAGKCQVLNAESVPIPRVGRQAGT